MAEIDRQGRPSTHDDAGVLMCTTCASAVRLGPGAVTPEGGTRDARVGASRASWRDDPRGDPRSEWVGRAAVRDAGSLGSVIRRGSRGPAAFGAACAASSPAHTPDTADVRRRRGSPFLDALDRVRAAVDEVADEAVGVLAFLLAESAPDRSAVADAGLRLGRSVSASRSTGSPSRRGLTCTRAYPYPRVPTRARPRSPCRRL